MRKLMLRTVFLFLSASSLFAGTYDSEIVENVEGGTPEPKKYFLSPFSDIEASEFLMGGESADKWTFKSSAITNGKKD